MRALAPVVAGLAAVLAAGTAVAAPTVEIRNAVANVIVAPGQRSDVQVVVLRGEPRLPLRVWTLFGRVVVDGGLADRIGACRSAPAQVFVSGVGEVSPADAPVVLVRTPLRAKVIAGGAIWGRVGRAAALDLVNAGCGSWMAANVSGPLKISQAGPGQMRAGTASSADLVAAGSGSIATRAITGPVHAVDLGAGDIDVAAIDGPLDARVVGSGSVRVGAGRASAVQATIAGSGDISLRGVAGALSARVVGSGDVSVARVTGPVSKAVVGSGDVRVGS